MGGKPRVDRSPEEKWQIVQEGIKGGNVSETCRRHGIAPNLFYRWRDEAEIWAGPAMGWAYLVRCDRLLHAGDRGLESFAALPNRRCTDGDSSRPCCSEFLREAVRPT